MTAIVGVLCRDGLVIGTDSSTTFGTGFGPTIEQPTEKLSIIEKAVIVAGTGQVGMGQRFNRIVEVAWGKKAFGGQNHHIDVGKALAKAALEDFSSTFAHQKQYAALVGFSLGAKPHLCEFAISDFQPEFKDERIWYCSMGSGQPITDPFLALMREVFWAGGPPTVQDATFAVTWTLDHAVNVNPGGINAPVRIAVMEKKVGGGFAARMLDESDLAEHRQNTEQAKDRLRKLPDEQKPDAAGVPEIPQPPT